MRHLKRRWWVILIVVLIVMIAPFTVSAAITDTQVIAILNAGFTSFRQGLVEQLKLAYCASGVTALC